MYALKELRPRNEIEPPFEGRRAKTVDAHSPGGRFARRTQQNRRRAARQQCLQAQRELEGQQLVLPWVLNNWMFTVGMRKFQTWVGPHHPASRLVLVGSGLLMLTGLMWVATAFF